MGVIKIVQEYTEEFFQKKFMKTYLKMVIYIFLSFLIVPMFTVAGYIANIIGKSSEEGFMEDISEMSFLKLTKDGFLFVVYTYGFIFVLLAIIFLPSVILIESASYQARFLIAIILLPIIFIPSFAFMTAYCKERKFFDSLKETLELIKNPTFYVYLLVFFLVSYILSFLVIPILLIVPLFYTYGILGLVYN